MNDSKICNVCKVEKSLNDFYKHKKGFLNRQAKCKECFKKMYLPIINKSSTNYYKLHPEKYKESYRKYYEKNKIKCLEYRKKYYSENKDVLNQYSREYYSSNKTKSNEYGKTWRKNNADKCREYARNRYKKNLELATVKWMRNFLYRTEKFGFNKEYLNTVMEFGYSPRQLIQRIECQFKEGMSWNNRKEWHIDHKKPISSFKKGTSPKTINMLSNLQPIWKTDNLSKGSKF
jgi:hypothetical protein